MKNNNKIKKELWQLIVKLNKHLKTLRKRKYKKNNLFEMGMMVDDYIEYAFYRGKLYAYGYALQIILQSEIKNNKSVDSRTLKRIQKKLSGHQLYFTRAHREIIIDGRKPNE